MTITRPRRPHLDRRDAPSTARPARTSSPRRSPSSRTSGCSRRTATATATCSSRPTAAARYRVPRPRAAPSSTGSIDARHADPRRVDGEPRRPRRAGARRRVRRRCSASRRAAADLPRGARQHARRRRPGSSSTTRRRRRRPRRTPTTRTIEAAMTEGHPAFVANNGRIGFGARRLRGVRPGDRARRSGWSGSAARRDAQPPLARRGPRRGRRSTPASSTRRRRAALRRDGCASSGSTRPTTCWLPVHPWQWTQQGGDHLRPRRGPRATSCCLGDGPRRLPGAAVDPHVLQRSPARPALREDGAGDPEHGLPARAVAGLHAGDAGDQRLGRRRRRPPTTTLRRVRVRGAARAGRDRLHRRRLPPARRARRRTRRCSPRCGARARCRGSRRASGWPRWRRCCTATRDGAVAASPRWSGRSGLAADEWVRRYLRAYLRPLVHCLLRPRPGVHAARREPDPGAARPRAGAGAHEGHRRGGRGARRPAAAARRRADPARRRRPTCKALAILTDVFDGFLRHLAGDPRRGRRAAPRTTFWAAVADCVRRARAPTTRSWPTRSRRTTCCAPEFRHTCLNRLQLRNTLQMVDLAPGRVRVPARSHPRYARPEDALSLCHIPRSQVRARDCRRQSSSGSSRRASQVANRSTGVSNSGCTSVNSWSRSATQAEGHLLVTSALLELLDPAVGEVHGQSTELSSSPRPSRGPRRTPRSSYP